MVLTNNEYSNLVACQWILAGTFSRAFYEISIANEFWDRLQEKLSARGVDASLQAEIATFRAEARS
jgi:hypothetical protein